VRFILKDVRQWKIRYDVLRFGVLLLVVVIIWAGIELFNTYSTTTIPKDYSKEIEPFNPSLDLEMISEIEGREETPEKFDIVIQGEVVEEEIIETETITPSSLLNPSPPASGSGL
jgi:hypothetical protein